VVGYNEGLNISNRDKGEHIRQHFACRNGPCVRCLANLATGFGLPVSMQVRQDVREHED
jgi:hypothetical protein